MSRTIQLALSHIESSDIIHGVLDHGPSLILLVREVAPRSIICRRITTGETMRFDRATGVLDDPRGGRIDSIAPLPLAHRHVLLQLDRFYRLSDMGTNPERFRLSDEQKDTLAFTQAFYPANPVG